MIIFLVGQIFIFLHGELSVFPHLDGQDKLVHFSLNAGAPVVSAGEIQIADGELIFLTTHSGYYRPNLFSVYRTLEYFDKQGIDISEAKVYTFGSKPWDQFPKMKVWKVKLGQDQDSLCSGLANLLQ